MKTSFFVFIHLPSIVNLFFSWRITITQLYRNYFLPITVTQRVGKNGRGWLGLDLGIAKWELIQNHTRHLCVIAMACSRFLVFIKGLGEPIMMIAVVSVMFWHCLKMFLTVHTT